MANSHMRSFGGGGGRSLLPEYIALTNTAKPNAIDEFVS